MPVCARLPHIKCGKVYGFINVLQGYGTVRFGSREDAEKAVQECHGTELEGRTLTVKIDK